MTILQIPTAVRSSAVGLLLSGVVSEEIDDERSQLILTVHARNRLIAKSVAKNHVRLQWKIALPNVVSITKEENLGRVEVYAVRLEL